MLRRKPFAAGLGLVTAALLAAALVPSASAAPAVSDHLKRAMEGGDGNTFPGAEVPVGDAERRGPWLAPLAEAEAAVASLPGAKASYNRFGTVGTLTRFDGPLEVGVPGSTPLQVARTFLGERAGLIGLTAAQVDGLEVVNAEEMAGSGGKAHVVVLRQRLAGLPLAEGGLVSVTVRGDRVIAVSSSAVAARTLGQLSATRPSLDAAAAVLAAARDAGITSLKPADLKVRAKKGGGGFTLVAAKGLTQPGMARLAVLPTTDRGARLVWETNVVDTPDGRALAVTGFVDALSGAVLLRRDAVDTAAPGTAGVPGMSSIGLPAAAGVGAVTQVPSGSTFNGTFSATACSADIPLSVPAGSSSVAVVAHAVLPSNDIVVVIKRGGTTIASGDTGTSPEAATASLDPVAQAGDTFVAQVCPFDAASVMAPFEFAGSYVASNLPAVAAPGLPGPFADGSLLGPATYRAFASNPLLAGPDNAMAPDDRGKVCNASAKDAADPKLEGCTDFTYFDASRLPYDVDPITGIPTFITLGNNAVTTNAQLSTSLTPGGPFNPGASPTRDYAGTPATPDFTDSWRASSCAPTTPLDPAENRADVDAAIVNLFVGHNRTHDYSYLLGLTEERGALQTSNYGKGGAELDPEIGNAQNAASTQTVFTTVGPATTPAGGLPVTGRNNANQITLQDGVPGITNQYLFQPVVGFAGPCADGDLDGSIFLHEYTHAISNRLVGGPDTGLSGAQAGAMGESWSDLVALEYLNAFGLAGKRGEDPFSVGAYATGNADTGIRNFNASRSPLNYSDVGYDASGPQVHADGEIWSATQLTVRKALIEKYDGLGAPADDLALQKSCALGRDAAGAVSSTFQGCPGNRRWVTYLLAAMYMQANGDPSMVDQKDMMLAADEALNGGKDKQVIAKAYATRGLGAASESVTNADGDPTPSFASPVAADNARVTFALRDSVTGAPVKGSVFVGAFQARATPVATTLGAGNPSPTATLVGGDYAFVVQAPGYGLQRFTGSFARGAAASKTFVLMPNLASSARSAGVTGDGVRLDRLLDDDEGTNGGFDGLADRTPVAGRTITVDLAGTAPVTVGSVAVSALHRPLGQGITAEDAPDFQGRLLGINDFKVLASTDGKNFTEVYASPDDLFPVVRPRAVAPDINLRTVALSKPVQATHLRLEVLTNNCTGTAAFQGEQEADDTSTSDCLSSTAPNANPFQVVVSEFQAFSGGAAVTVPPLTPAAPAAPTAPGAAPVAGGNGGLAATGGSGVLAGLGLLLLVGAGLVVRRRRQTV